ncbi:MAG: GHKL domain-containing protein [Lachnospiraceae bacterium]|nr:GHKL domain-containing protein [Lachnospiraceae bacterium]
MSRKIDGNFIMAALKRIAICLSVYLAVFFSYSLILSYFFGIAYAPEYHMSFFIGSIVLSVLLFLYKYLKTKKRNSEIEKQNKLLKEHYEMIQEMYNGNAKLYHDFHNHMNIIYHLLEEKDFQEAKTYIEKISEPVREISKFSMTGNDVVDIVINSKRKIMEQHGIKFAVKAEFPPGMHIDSHDICIILTNLLDNALESSVREKGRGGQPLEVQLIMRRIHGFMFIKITNFCKKEPGRFLYSTKENPALHGFGLQNVKNVVGKYHGILKTEYSENQFKVLVMIPL